jgi:hypothetical protein
MGALAHRAERAGFDLLTISDHDHPWTHRKGESAGLDQGRFFDLYESEVLPGVRAELPARG